MSTYQEINSQQSQDWLDAGEVLLVDVREPHEFNEFRIPQAISMPLTNINECLGHLTKEKRKIVFQCLKGKRGELAAHEAISYDIDAPIYNLIGGIDAWKEEGRCVVGAATQEEQGIPLPRQVMITAGGAVALSSLFALLDFQFGAFLSFIIGGGLVYSGTTGQCGLAKILQKMPWNK